MISPCFINRIFNALRQALGLSLLVAVGLSETQGQKRRRAYQRFRAFHRRAAPHQHADAVFCGHIHHAEIRQVGPVLYLNDGDWVESCTALVEDFIGKLSIIRWADERDELLRMAQSKAA